MAVTEIWSESGVSVICGQAKLVKRGLYQWTTTNLTGTIAVPMRQVESAIFSVFDAQTGGSENANMSIETFSATYVKDFVAPRTGVITAFGIIAAATTSSSSSDSNNYTFGVTNVTQTLTAVDATVAANSNKATGGTGFAPDTLFAFTIGNAANCAVTSGDILKFTATKTGTFTVTAPTLVWSYSTAGGVSEEVRWTDTRGLDGKLLLANSASQVINFARKSISPVSGGYFFATITGIG